MESIMCLSSTLPFNPISGRRKLVSENWKRVNITKVLASRREAHDRSHGGGRGGLVDENMIVLRKRIHETRMMERNYEPPSDWMEWEKHWYTRYDSVICEAMGFLQSQLMDTRPSLALGMVVLIGLSVPTSMAVIFLHLTELSKGVLAGIH